MKGLMKSNLYATSANAKIFSAVMALLGIFMIVMGSKIPALIIGYMLSVMVGFSFISIASVCKDSTAKWAKHKLTAPLKRADIIKSFFASQLLWLVMGMTFAGTTVTLCIALHGYPFDRTTDIFMLFVVGIGVSLFMGAIFFPLFFLGGDERNEVLLIVSILCSIGIIIGLIILINSFFPSPMNTLQLILGGTIILACSILTFTLSYPLTVKIFKRKEY
ncbi:MAG: ABC-2 transporter permease [Lachnospiraceae bacterium]|nr:ABC-2 transporter permease [Lachnospiraceae bacterium]